jgi:hypothetical protein
MEFHPLAVGFLRMNSIQAMRLALDRLRLEERQQVGIDPTSPLPPITTIFIVDASHICFS